VNDRPRYMTNGSFKNADVWLMMLAEGGRWSAAQVGARIDMDQTSVASNLRAMASFGCMKRYERDPMDRHSRVRFGITPECVVPRGITLTQLLETDLMNTHALHAILRYAYGREPTEAELSGAKHELATAVHIGDTVEHQGQRGEVTYLHDNGNADVRNTVTGEHFNWPVDACSRR
jgi:hypothetical protein